MKSIKQLFRLIHIQWILAKNGIDQFVVSLPIFAPFKFVVYLNPWHWFRKTPITPGVALRQTLEELGPIYVKFGQALSTRPDILDPEVALELSKLQDKVPPFPVENVLASIEAAFGRSAYALFAEFDSEPLASASMAQVHAAKLLSGESVVVKVLRPNIQKRIQQDISMLKTMAKWLQRLWPRARQFKALDVVKEFERNLREELDLEREAANGAQLKRNFSHSPLLYIPQIYWDYVRHDVLVMERIYGIPVSDIEALKHHGVNLKKLAERGIELFFTQVFRDCFFHADMHPGNIFVSTKDPENPQYICIDFGIIGTLDDKDKHYLAENLLAFFNRDYRRVAELHIESNWVSQKTRVGDFESAIRTVCEPIFEKPLKDISFALLMLRLFQVARTFRINIQPQLILLQKTLLAIEGLGRQLYPELNLWVTAKPYLEDWIKQQLGPKAFFKNLKNQAPYILANLPLMPQMLHELVLLTKENTLKQLAQKNPEPEKRTSSRKLLAAFGLGVLCASLLFYIQTGFANDTNTQPQCTIINYWAMWCDSCLSEIKVLNQFYAQHHHEIKLYAFNYDELSEKKLKHLTKELKIHYPVLQKNPAKALHLEEPTALPATYFLNAKGKRLKTLYGPLSLKRLEQTIQQSNECF